MSTGKYVIPYFLKSFMDQHPRVEISIDVSNKNKVIEGLVRNEHDFSLVSVLPEGIQVNAIELMDNRLYLVGERDHPTKVKKPKDLEKVTLLFREEGSATRIAMERFLDINEISANKSMELVSNEAVKQAINAGLGFSIVPLIGLRTALANENMQIYPLKGLPITTKWNLIYNKGKKLTPAQEALTSFINEQRHEVMMRHFGWAMEVD